jgi:hypothetical protein
MYETANMVQFVEERVKLMTVCHVTDTWLTTKTTTTITIITTIRILHESVFPSTESRE